MITPPSVDIVFFAEGDGGAEDLLPLIALGDAVVSQRHRLSASMANHDVEDGVEITDHYRRNRDPVVLSIVISDSPLEGGDVELTRRVDAWALLERAVEEGLEAIVTTRLSTYEGLYLEEATTEVTAADATWQRIELTFMPIRKVSTELVEDVAPDRDRRIRNAGAVALQDPTANESTAYALSGGDPSRYGSTYRDPLGAVFGGG
jgi:hypothetical protein